jgi:transposase
MEAATLEKSAEWHAERIKPADNKVDVDALLQLREGGKTQAQCAQHFGVHSRVISRILRQVGSHRSIVTRNVGRCPICSADFEKSRSSQKTCSRLCAMRLRANPDADEARVATLYDNGYTQQEIAEQIGVSLKSVQKAMRRADVTPRRRVKRDQFGERNDTWRGKDVGYKAAHQRVRRYRGEPKTCKKCSASAEERPLEWANISRRYYDPNDYVALCIPCHRRWDAERKRCNGSA